MSIDKKTIFLIVGQTASGKDSLINAMCNIEKPPKQDVFGDFWRQGNYKQLISYATRPRRENEGDTHIFIQPSEVEQYKDQIVAYTKIGDYEYFATKDQLKECDFYIIDYLGIKNLRSQNLNDEFRFVTIYIDYDEELEDKLTNNTRWLNIIRKIRENINLHGIKMAVSPRASMQGADLLESGFSMN